MTAAKRFAGFVSEISRRGGETSIIGRYETVELRTRDRRRVGRRVIYLLACHGWRQYSKRYGARRASLAYLCGTDDNGPWAVRVPGNCDSVEDALDFVEPSEVKMARAAGRRVLRQGDAYAVETRTDSGSNYWLDPQHAWVMGSHTWHPRARVLLHEPAAGDRKHAPLCVPYPCKIVFQRAYEMGRSGRRGGAD